MLYVATVHWKSDKWIDIQLRYLKRNVSEPFQTFAVLNGIDPEFDKLFDTVVPAYGMHAGKLNLLAAEIGAVGKPDDIILFLDGDAFPIADPMPAIHQALSEGSLLAVRRDENSGDPQPHPCFCAIRVAEWQRLQGDWSPGKLWTNRSGEKVTDVGGNLYASLIRTGSRWTPLLRSNLWNPHPLWFGIYGDVVYHHGAGFRPGKPTRADKDTMAGFGQGEGLPVVGGLARMTNGLRRGREAGRVFRQSQALSAEWFARLQSDPDFFRPLLTPGGAATRPQEVKPGNR
ncbi:MAG TPA: hypothetical protein VIJ09_00540 [Acidimicrobiales bacterium]